MTHTERLAAMVAETAWAEDALADEYDRFRRDRRMAADRDEMRRVAARERRAAQRHLRATVNAVRVDLGMPTVEQEQREAWANLGRKFAAIAEPIRAIGKALLPGFRSIAQAVMEAERQAQRDYALAGPAGGDA